MSNAATQACIQMHTALAAMTNQPGFGLVANGIVDDEIAFVNPGDGLEPLAPEIRVGREFEQLPEHMMTVHSHLEALEAMEAIHSGRMERGYFADRKYIKSILATPLGEYLPETDPRDVEPVEERDEAWDKVRGCSLNDLVDAVRMVRAATYAVDATQPAYNGKVPEYGFSFLGKMIFERGTKVWMKDNRRREHILISALLLTETTSHSLDFAKGMSDRVSRVAEEYAQEGRHDAAAMLYERALMMFVPFSELGKSVGEAKAEVMVKAATEWFEARTRRVDIDAFRWRLSRAMRLAWEGGDMSLLGQLHETHQHMFEGFEQHFEGAKSRVRRASTEVEHLRQRGWGLGDRFANQKVWESVGNRLGDAHDLFEQSGHSEFADEAGSLSEKAYEIQRTI